MGIPTRATLGLLALAGAAGLALWLLGGSAGLRQEGSRTPAPPVREATTPTSEAPASLQGTSRIPERRPEPSPQQPSAPAAPAADPLPPGPAAHLAGALADPLGRWVGELPVHWRTGRQVARSTTSDVFGAFQLADLPCVPGELVLGDPSSPIAPPRPLELQPGVVDLGTIEVPLLGELLLRVLDEEGRPVADVGLSGTGDRGGSIVARSGPDGEARARLLPRGMYRVFGSHPDHGRGNTVFEYAPDAPAAVEVRLRRSAPPE